MQSETAWLGSEATDPVITLRVSTGWSGRARMASGRRLFEARGNAITAEDLMTIGAAEILASRVLAEPAA